LAARLFRGCVATIDPHHHLFARSQRCFKVSANKLVIDCVLPNNNAVIRFLAAPRSPFLRRPNRAAEDGQREIRAGTNVITLLRYGHKRHRDADYRVSISDFDSLRCSINDVNRNERIPTAARYLR